MAKTKTKKPKPLPGVWGIDLGQCALKAVRLENVDGKITATAFDYVEHAKILNQPDADPDQLTREALEKFLSRNVLKGDDVAISVPGQTGALARFVKLPPVEEKKINDIVRFEAKQQIPFPLDEVIWDYQKIGSGAVSDGFAMETEIGLFAMKRDLINRSLQQYKDVNVEVYVIQMAPLALCNFVSYDLLKKGAPDEKPAADAKKEGTEGEEPAAKEEEHEEEDPSGKKRCVVALDIGTDNSNLVITDGERIIWQRPIPQGGNHITRALSKDLKLTFAKAEHLKRNATKSPDLKRILQALKPVLNDFAGEVQRSLGYFTNTHRGAQIAYMVGLGNAFRLPGLQKFLSEKLQLDVRRLQKFERLAGDNVLAAPAFSQNLPTFGVAYGLALQGLKQTRLHTNLLPQNIQTERLIRAKKPWAVAAAASLLIGVISMAVGYGAQYRAVNAPEIQKEIDANKTLKQNVEGDDAAYKGEEQKVVSTENSVKTIIVGQAERPYWILLNQFLNECLPVPGIRVDGKFQGLAPDKKDEIIVRDKLGREQRVPLSMARKVEKGKPDELRPEKLKKDEEVTIIYQPDEGAREYWTPQAQAEFLKQWERQAKGGTDSEDEGLDHLIQVNLEAVDTRFFPDLKSYWSRLQNDQAGKDAVRYSEYLPKIEQTTPPDGKGWVVELRGYTYYPREPRKFLLNTLVKKIIKRTPNGAPAPAGAAGTSPAAGQPKKEPEKAPGAKPKEPEPIDVIVANRVSHVLLYQAHTIKGQGTGSVQGLIRNGVVGGLTGGGASGGPAAGAKPNEAAVASKSWDSLLGSGGGSAIADPNKIRRGPAKARQPAPTTKQGSGGSVPTPAKGDQDAAGSQYNRTEFIILLVWKEPAPGK